jgi:hypothetical protein
MTLCLSPQSAGLGALISGIISLSDPSCSLGVHKKTTGLSVLTKVTLLHSLVSCSRVLLILWDSLHNDGAICKQSQLVSSLAASTSVFFSHLMKPVGLLA